MAVKKSTRRKSGGTPTAEIAAAAAVLAECPVFVFRADRAGHIHALIAATSATALMPEADSAELVTRIRDFELWMDAQNAQEE